MSSFGRFTQALGGVVETLSYASPTLTLTQSVGTSPLTANIPSGGGISGSGTTGYIPKFTGSTALGNSIISESAGIITITGRLVANGVDYHSLSVADGGAQLRLERTGSGAGLMYLGADSFGFKIFDSAFTTRFFVGNTGNVGIGTTNPTNGKLVVKDSGFQYIAEPTDAVTYGYLGIGHFANGTFIGSYAGTNNVSDILRFGTNGSERMRIFSNGRIAINSTVDAGYQFDVNGTARVSSNFALTTAGAKINFDNALRYIQAVDGSDYFIISQNAFASGIKLGFDNGTTFNGALTILNTGSATFSSNLDVIDTLAIGNTITATAPDINTHKVEIAIGGVTYYLLASDHL